MSCGHWCILSNNQDVSYPVLFLRYALESTVTSRAMFNLALNILCILRLGIKKHSNRQNIINFEFIIFHNDRCSGFDIESL